MLYGLYGLYGLYNDGREILISPPWRVAGMICTSTHLGTFPEAYRWSDGLTSTKMQEALHYTYTDLQKMCVDE